MRIHDPHTEAEEPYNLVPLTDMVFNLLIFFMCATTFVQIEKDLKVQLPKASSSFVPISAPPKQLIINIEQDGTTKVADKAYDATALAALVASSSSPASRAQRRAAAASSSRRSGSLM